MIKARGQAAGTDMVILGLSRNNTERLLNNSPIMFDGAQVGLAGVRIVICGGETEADIAEDLRSIGFDGSVFTPRDNRVDPGN